MGQEAQCTLRYRDRVAVGTAHLDSAALRFRGEIRLSVPIGEIREVAARDGRLLLTLPDGVAVLELGAAATTWAAKIKHPRSLLDKLGVKPGARVAILGLRDDDFLAQLRERTADVTMDSPAHDTEVLFYAADRAADLSRLRALVPYLARTGALWVVRPKGVRAITERDVMAAGKAAGLVDVKVVSFSATHTAEKFVIPVPRR